MITSYATLRRDGGALAAVGWDTVVLDEGHVLLIDGVDEAADLAHIVEDYVTTELVPRGHPVVVTSRPEPRVGGRHKSACVHRRAPVRRSATAG